VKRAILGIGNVIMTDDAVGVHAARRARELLGPDSDVEVIEAQMAGFALLDLLADRDRVVVIDALVDPHREPGDVFCVDVARFAPTSHLAGGHQIDLPTALELGRRLGLRMPSEVTVVAVVVVDAMTLGESMTGPVRDAVDTAAREAVRLADAR
jgi:hydrogenase maturation protease